MTILQLLRFEKPNVPETELERISLMPRAFLDGLGVGISLADADTGILRFANKECCRILGFSAEELTSGEISFLELTHPEDRTRNQIEQKRLCSGEVANYRLQERYLRRNGEVVWADVTVNAIQDSQGRIRWCAAAIQDVTATKVIEQQLAAAQELSGVATWQFTVKTNTSETSTAYNGLFGVAANVPPPSLDELIQRVHPDDRQAVTATIKRALTSKRGYTHEYRIIRNGGEIRWLRGFANCQFDAAGEVTSLIGATIDITDARSKHPDADAPTQIRRMLLYIEENLSRPLKITELAPHFGISARQVHRYFHAQGMSLAQHIKQLRLQRARQQLTDAGPDATVTGIALACGFMNPGHFARDYSLEYGELPSQTLYD
jgi:PAS domain S-box-containing protein